MIATAYTELLTGDPEQRPIADLLIKPFQRDRFALALNRGRQWRKQALDEKCWYARLSLELRDRTKDICARLRRHADRTSEAEVLTTVVLEHDREVMAHGQRVARYAVTVAREIGVDSQLGNLLELAARFHDCGKAAIPDALLTKPSPLTAGETAIMQRHVETGAEILASTRTLHDLTPLVLATHEWFGGGGYPNRLAESAIPLASRIIAVADAYDAMTHDRHYRNSIDSADAVSELLRCQSTQFDPDVVTAFLAVLSRH